MRRELALARGRGRRRQPADGGKHSADQHRQPSDYPAHLCDPLHTYPTAYGSGNGDGMPCLIPSRFSYTLAIATKSPL